MKIKDIVKLTNTYLAGEQLVYQKLLPFYDAVIDDINSRLNSTYPSFTDLNFTRLDRDDAVYDFFPDRYIRSVVALGGAHKFYMMDEEGVSYDEAYTGKYEEALFYMTRDYIDQVPEIFQSDSRGSVAIHLDDDVAYEFPICPGLLRGL